jgi:hypothetical protein
MAAVTITAVGLSSDCVTEKVQFGGASFPISPGDACYMDTSDGNKWKLADADEGAAEAGRDGIGIMLTTVQQDGEYGMIVKSGTVLIDTGLTKGTAYVVGATAGAIQPDSDSTSNWYKTVLGVAGTEGSGTTDFDQLIMKPVVSGQQIA